MDLKIGMITPWAVKCGIHTYSRDLTNALVQQGAEVYIIRLPRFGRKNEDILRDVAERVPVDKIDIIVVQHEYGLYQFLEGGFYGALKRLGKPIVTTMHAVGNIQIDSVIRSASDEVIVHNMYCGRLFRFPCMIIPHGTTIVECPPKEECRKNMSIEPTAFVVGYLGFIGQYKGLETLINAMMKVPDAGLLIGGGWHVDEETEYMARLKDFTNATLGHRCKWLGYVADEDMPMVYGAMDLFVYPSIIMTESGALLTALGHGKATIASDVAPVREKVKLGALINFKNVDDLANKIKKILRNKDLRTQLEEGAKAYAETVSWDKIAEKHISLYKHVIGSFKEKTALKMKSAN